MYVYVLTSLVYVHVRVFIGIKLKLPYMEEKKKTPNKMHI